MKSFFNFMKGKKDDKKEKIGNAYISVEITNPSGQKVQSEDEHIEGLQSGYGYDIDLNGKDKVISKLHKAAWQGNLDKIKVYAKKGDINLVDEFNRTALHLASAQGHTNVVWYLLSNKAAMEVYDAEGMTPFLKAVECGVKECVHLLIERGVDFNATDRNGNTGLHLAARQGFFNIMSLLLKKGANYDCSNNMGEMPLHIAAEQEHKDLAELLLQYGAHINVVDRDNRTPLMLAARKGQAALISLFLEYGAHLETCDSNGWTAGDYALIGGHNQFVAELKVPVTEIHIEDESLAKDSINSLSLEVIPEHITNGSENGTDEINNEKQPEDSNDYDFKSPPNSILVVDEEAQDSPRSCITPPPLKPPRSWEMIQAGMIDNSQVRRRSLLALGTLRSHRDSFSDANITSPHSAVLANNVDADVQDFSNLASKDIVHCKQSSDTEWESEDSLPLDRSLPLPPTDIIITPDRRSKNTLERTPSLDLTDDDHSDYNIKMETDFLPNGRAVKDKEEETWLSNNFLPNQDINIKPGENNNNVNKAINSNDVSSTKKIIYDTGQVSQIDNCNSVDCVTNEGYMNIIQNINIENESIEFNGKGKVRKLCSLDNLDDVSSRYIEIESSYSCDQLDSESLDKLDNICSESFSIDTLNNTETGAKDCDLAQSLDSLEESPFGTVIKRNVFHESHSLELLEGTSNTTEFGKPVRRHARHKSITVNSNWSKSVDVLVKPSNIDKNSIDSKNIDAQLQCYDEALRELEQDKLMKIKSSQSLDSGSLLNGKTTKVQRIKTNSKAFSTDTHNLDFLEYHNAASFQDRGSSNHDKISITTNGVRDLRDISLVSNLQAAKEEIKLACVSVNLLPSSSDSDSSHQISISGKCSNTSYESQTKCKRLINNTEAQNIILHSDSVVNHTQENNTFCTNVSKSCNSLEHPINLKSDFQSKSDKNISYSNISKNSALENISSDVSSVGHSKIVKPLKEIDKLSAITYGESSGSGYRNPKVTKYIQKCIRKEKSESEIENKFKLERNSSNTKTRAGRSISMYVEQMQIKEELLKNSKTLKDDLVLSEKSESDSEWSEKPLRNKRKQLLAMRGIIADPKDSDDSNEEDPPFWLSTDKGGCFARQDTVVYQPANINTPQNSPQHETNQKKESHEDTEADQEEISKAEGTENFTSSSSSEVSDSASVTQSDATPRHTYTLRTHQNQLKDHLKHATTDKVKLEEAVAQLKDQVERLQYELADTTQHVAAKDDKVIILQEELSRLGEKYASALDDVHTLKHQLSSQNVELKYLRDSVNMTNPNPDKVIPSKDPTNKQLLEYLEEVIQANKHAQAEKEALIAQNVTDIRKLQEDTIHWKELYEEAMCKLERLEALCQPHLLENLKDVDSLKFSKKDFLDSKNLDHENRKEKLPLNSSLDSAGLWDRSVHQKVDPQEGLPSNSDLKKQSSKPSANVSATSHKEIDLCTSQDPANLWNSDVHFINQSKEGYPSHSELKTQLSKPPSNVIASTDVNIDPLSKQNTSQHAASLWNSDVYAKEGLPLHSDLQKQLSKTPTNITTSNDVNVDPLSRQVILLEQQLEQERNKQVCLDAEICKLMKELQKKLDAEVELDKLYTKIEEEYVPREQLKQLQSQHSALIEKIQKVNLENENKFDSKLKEVNQIIEAQILKQVDKEKERDKAEMEIKQEFEYTRRKLLFELSKVQAALKAKECEEKILRERCEKLTQEAEKSDELKRRQLIEKSYSVNLVDLSATEKQLSVKQTVIPPPPPPPPYITSASEASNPFSATSLRQQLEHSIRKHKDSKSEQNKNEH